MWGGGGGGEEGEERVRDESVTVEELRMDGWMKKGRREKTRKEDRHMM